MERSPLRRTGARAGAHHAAGRFRNPWPGAEQAGLGGLLRWMIVERVLRRGARPREPHGWAPLRTTPTFDAPRAAAGAITATWVGHSTFLVQLGGWNVLTDPVWSGRASPVSWAGPRRVSAPGVAFDALPPIDLVVLSHDHYDHFDDATIRRIAARWPAARWAVPLGVARRLPARGIAASVELDWWECATVGPLSLTCVPAQHFSGRGPTDRDHTLWCGWSLRAARHDAIPRAAAPRDARAVYFAGDTGLHPAFDEIARRSGPFALALLPVGAYAPRWFMRPVHCDPADALAAYDALCAGIAAVAPHAVAPCAEAPVFGATHWGTFRLTDEPLDEPARLTRALWARAGRDASRLWVPALGETRRI